MNDNSAPENLNPLESLGLDIRQVRTARKITQKGLGGAIGYSESYVSKVEAGTIVASEKFVAGCDQALGTGALFVRQLRRVLEGDHPSWFVSYIQLERRAAQILDYSNAFIMGLLQTEEYARAVFRAGNPRDSVATIESKVSVRIKRHELLDGETPPLLWVVLHESCLLTEVGGTDVMARQLEHLVREADSPHVTLQLVPCSEGAPATGTAFTLLSFAAEPTVLYAEGPQGGRPYENAKTVAAAIATYDRLRAQAMSPQASIARLKTLHKERIP